MASDFKSYYREKRIRRILGFYHQNQNVEAPIISRDAKVHFFLTAIGLVIFPRILAVFPIPGFLNFMIAGFIAVECADYIMIRGMKFFDRLFDIIIPVTVFAVVMGLVVGQKYFGVIDTMKDKFLSFRDRYNDELQSKPKKNVADIGSGENWILLGFEKGNSQPMTLQESLKICSSRGPEWKMYDGTQMLTPPLVLKTSQYFWVKNMAGQMGPGEATPPTAWMLPEKNTKVLALCVREKP